MSISTSRNGRPGKHHKASTWQANDAFWITVCGLFILKSRAAVDVISQTDARPEPFCESCRRSLMPDGSSERLT